MRITIHSSYDFVLFISNYSIVKDRFSIEGLHALYDYLEELNDGDDYDIYPVDLAIYYEEFDSLDDIILYFDINEHNDDLSLYSITEKEYMIEEHTSSLFQVLDTGRYIAFVGGGSSR